MNSTENFQAGNLSILSHAGNSLCSSCTGLFKQPTKLLETEVGDPLKSPYRRLGKAVLESAETGCALCVLVWSRLSTLLRRQMNHQRLEEIMIGPSFGWHTDTQEFGNMVYWATDDGGDGSVFPELFKVDFSPTSVNKPITLGEPGSLDTDSDQCRSLAARWIGDCISNHKDCRNHNPDSWLPTRLIDVGHKTPLMKPKLILAASLPQCSSAPPYLSLSHLWAAESVLRLTTSNQSQLMQGIPLANLSPTFRDAISFTQQLGIRYIWIDSLCILQDSPVDWAVESAHMNRVYKHSTCNIAATAASNYSPGLYQRRDPRMVTPYSTLIEREGYKRIYTFSLSDDHYNALGKASLNVRGWVFQERMLSLRTLHFSSQLIWECRMLQACETYPEGFPRAPITLVGLDEPSWSNSKLWEADIDTDPASMWALLLGSYCKTKLTRSSDRLAAIAGLAQEVHAHTGDEYLAGLWKQQLPASLCWMSLGTETSGEFTRPDIYRCPSWSWASLDFSSMMLQFLDCGEIKRQVAIVVESHIKSSSGNVYTQITGGHLQLRGCVREVRLGHLRNASWRGDRYGHWTFEICLDVNDELDHETIESYEDRDTVWCMPIVTWDRSITEALPSLQVYCLVLDDLNDEATEFTRIGWMSVLYDWEEDVTEELRWITDYASKETWDAEDLITVTIY